ncbi:MAG: PadR family transcriptional regulator [Solirubrobacterales bacterium]
MGSSSSTRHVILGMLQTGPKSGYDIKRLVDHSTRFFWGASFGQIYPELARLAEQGLITEVTEPEAQAPELDGRGRTAWELTEAGHQELQSWLHEPPTEYRLRDEWMLKLFFCAAEPARAHEVLGSMARERTRMADDLREIRPLAGALPSPFPAEVLELGIAVHAFVADWCRDRARALDPDHPPPDTEPEK